MGSSLMHGGHTSVGGRYDNIMISMISYLSHTISLQHIPGGSSILRELNKTPRKASPVEEINKVTDMLLTKNIDEWEGIINGTDIRHEYYITFAALVASCTALLFPWWFVDLIVPPLGNQFIKNED